MGHGDPFLPEYREAPTKQRPIKNPQPKLGVLLF